MRTYNHVGIPTSTKPEQAGHMEAAHLYVSDFSTSPNRIEWLNFYAPGGCMPELLQKSTHIAYEVDSLEAERHGKDWLVEPFESAPGLMVAFIEEEGIPIELMQYSA